jgi:hypothetical protein
MINGEGLRVPFRAGFGLLLLMVSVFSWEQNIKVAFFLRMDHSAFNATTATPDVFPPSPDFSSGSCAPFGRIFLVLRKWPPPIM